MAYRDYQKLVFDLLRKRIEQIKKRKDREEFRKLIVGIRASQKVINKFYVDYPYCETCNCRQLKEHKCNGQ